MALDGLRVFEGAAADVAMAGAEVGLREVEGVNGGATVHMSPKPSQPPFFATLYTLNINPETLTQSLPIPLTTIHTITPHPHGQPYELLCS